MFYLYIKLKNDMYKESKFYSIFNNKCPVCHEGDFFQVNSSYDLKNFDKMHEKCPSCGERYEKEPGYFTGSMYISYALMVAFMVTCFVGFVGIFDFDIYYVLGVVVVGMIVLLPVFFRLARLIWINLFVDYNKVKAQAVIKIA